MKQILQNAKTGSLEIVEVPAPAVGPGEVLVRNSYSVMSPGTEKMAMDFARKSLLGKARSRPDLVRQVVRKLEQEGPLPTYRTVVNRLDSPQPLGYAAAGIAEEVGRDVRNVRPGDRLACAGAGYANHAEFVVVPENLTAHVPAALSLDRAAFATLGAIAMQGLRVGDPRLGEVVAVIGLGLIGQLTVQLLLASGCRVYGIDLDSVRVEQALEQGMDFGGAPGDDHARLMASVTGGHGVDLAVVTAASDSTAPIQMAAELCRNRGRVVAVGATAMDLDRRTFYEKELELRMSMSYGPGRYDRNYEELGLDYPLAYVRWTEQRNLQSFLDLAARGSIDPLRMDVESVDFDQSTKAYDSLARGERKGLAAVFRYAEGADSVRTLALEDREGNAERVARPGEVGVAFIGAGSYAKAVLLPGVGKEAKIRLESVITSTGPSARRTAERFGFSECGTDAMVLLTNEAVDLVFVASRHDSHSKYAVDALESGKSVWLEKPVGLSNDEVRAVAEAANASDGLLMVGFNRRFSGHARALQETFVGRRGPASITYSILAGATPSGTWLVDPEVGGGRILGEVCHFVDLCVYLVGALPVSVYARRLFTDSDLDDSVMALIGFADGSSASLSYLANGSAEWPKERFEIHADGRSARCDNYRTTELPGGKRVRGVNQDKGQAQALSETVAAVRAGQRSPIPLEEIVAVCRATQAICDSIASGRPETVARWQV